MRSVPVAAHKSHEGRRRQMQIHRQADATASRSSRSREAVAERAARPRPRCAGAAPGRALARRADRRRRGARPAGRRRITPAADLQRLRSLIAQRAQGRRAPRPSSAAGAPTASCSSSSRARRPMSEPAHRSGARPTTASASAWSRSATARPAASTRTRACPALQRLAGARAAQPDRLGDAARSPTSRRPSARRCASWSTTRGCDLVLTTGGTGPAPRDVTPEATLAVADKEMPGFGEQMRQISLRVRADGDPVAPGGGDPRQGADHQPARAAEGDRRDARRPAAARSRRCTGIFAAVPYCIDLIGGPYIETDAAVCAAFRPKSALRKPASP